MDQLEEDEEETKHNNSKLNGEKSSSPTKCTGDRLKSNMCLVMEMFLSNVLICSSFQADGGKGSNEEGDGEEMKNFNEDILCYHS